MSGHEPSQLEEVFANAARRARYLYFVFGVALVIYTLLGFVLKFTGILPPDGGFVFQRGDSTATLLAVGASVASLGIAAVVLLVLAPRRLRVPTANRDPEFISAELQQRALLTLALLEAPAILGLVVFLTSGNLAVLGLLAGVSVLLLLLTFPNEARWREAARTTHE
ncbi:hypothetical protein ARMA_2288 [Ardenticatena maritima]|uniref:Uncharacterized protein n=1 Tax=Ardenticatena maritima TaxID=872965 RepID=A0A0M8K8D8_9CHLR|nr:hypothetical protein [Ardenticatena maritima]KPL88331.1 hypothetical protein SE16_05760 [Ardenticatena maritima]GAP63865.1 hypothetical protein ARMA_2288 [Ardenticatena maritima]